MSQKRYTADAPANPILQGTLGDEDGPQSAVQKAFRLIDALLGADVPLQLQDLADGTGMAKPSVHRLMTQLEHVGLITRDLYGRRYLPGPELHRLSRMTLRAAARTPPVREVMAKLVDQVQESCNLGVIDTDAILYLERVECNWPLRMQLSAGSRVPLHCTASGKLLLALLPTRRRKRLIETLPLTAYSPQTIIDPVALEAECQRIREQGFSVNREEMTPGLIGLSVPVKGRDGETLAGLAIHAPLVRMTVDDALTVLPRLTEAAEAIAEEIDSAVG